MRFANMTLIRNIGIALLALLLTSPSIDAQQRGGGGGGGDRGGGGGGGDRGGGGGVAVRSAPVERAPAFVDRASHGSIRHYDTNIIQRPIAIRPNEALQQRPAPTTQNVGVAPRAYYRRDGDAYVNAPRNWDHFALGSRRHGLRPGYRRFLLNNVPYFYDDGIYYQQFGNVNPDDEDADYQEVYPPVGADIPSLPDGAVEVDSANGVYYYAGGAFYVQQGDGFVIVPTPIGVVVPDVPPGATEVSYNNGVAYQFNGAYYQPVFVNGVTQYQTVAPAPAS